MTEILYIEDNDQNFYLVSFIMKAAGHDVLRARDGQEGIALAREKIPRLILLDIQLPLMDGYATARELRKIPPLAKIPIVALTSYAMPGDKEKALAAGCSGYIEKPINPTTFTSQIQQFIRPEDTGVRIP
jgi:CheY-like chemotaxis protein